MHDPKTSNQKISFASLLAGNVYHTTKLEHQSIVKQKSILFPPLDEIEPIYSEKHLPSNPCPTPNESKGAKIRNFWNEKTTSKHKYLLGRDTPEQQVLLGWILPFKDGKIFKHSPGYEDFYKRFKDSSIYLSLNWIIQNIEGLLQHYGIQYADVFCVKIIQLAKSSFVWPLRKDDLILCIANPNEVIFFKITLDL